MKEVTKYEQLSEDRKAGQAAGTVPEWMPTAGYQMFLEKYLYEAENPREQYMRIAKTAAKHAPRTMLPGSNEGLMVYADIEGYWTDKFFNIMWKGWMACSTPVLANMGTDRGCPVSCAGSEMDNSIFGFYDNLKEMALLSKHGFGTATDLSEVQPRGSKMRSGGRANGVMPVIEDHILMSRKVSQGSSRRGAWAAYLNVMHGDFWEVINYLEKHDDDFNMGWIVTDEYIALLNKGDKEAHKRFKRMMKVKMVTGKGYFFFIDKVNRNRPQMYKDLGFMVKASQLCTEIFLHSDATKYTYTCVLAWMNASKYDEWKGTDAVMVATVFLDCVVSEFIIQAEKIPGLEKAVASTKAGRAIGLGAGGLHTYMQEHMMPVESLDAYLFNAEFFQHLNEQSLAASKWLAVELGEPEWCKGYGLRFTHRLAVAPTKSTALIMGGISEGRGFDTAMSFTQKTSAGEVDRVNPPLLALIKRKGLDVDACIKDVVRGYGSVQHVDWLTPEEKEVFKTAFEIDQRVVLRLAAVSQKDVDQGQSINVYIAKGTTEEQIAEIHQEAFLNELIHSLYYVYSSRAIVSSSSECVACQ
jgi:ribonucleoside-diphosphate reductase alpha chain